MSRLSRPCLLVHALLLTALACLAPPAPAGEYFVSKAGNDTQDGKQPATAFATIQKGVNILQPGDTLTIGPGEYHEAIKRTELGSAAAVTVLRAEVPGTVVVRGDVRAPAFRPLAGHRFVEVADFSFTGEVSVLNESDTLTGLQRAPNTTELEFTPGTFHHDPAAGKLYVATSDLKPASAHRYTVSDIPTHGIYLVKPRRVVIEGLVVTGFNAMRLIHYREGTAGGVWGIFLLSAKDCVIRDCQAFQNGWGIGLNSAEPGSGDNVIERCTAWGNKCPFVNGDCGGITVFAARRDVIRDSTAYRNGMYGINIYGTGGAPPGGDDGGNTEANKSRLIGNLSWGNETADFKVKTGYEYFHTAERCVAPGLWHTDHVIQGTIGRSTSAKKLAAEGHLVLSEEAGVDSRAEFADPDNHDYRLQSTSRFRAKEKPGADRGAFPYAANIFYVKPVGDDAADGLAVASAWRTLDRAAKALRPGDTLYLEPGEYQAGALLKVVARDGATTSVRGRGIGPVVIQGDVRVQGSGRLTFERLQFRGALVVEESQDIAFKHCTLASSGAGIAARGVRSLTASHCLFASSTPACLILQNCEGVRLSSNILNNASGPALRLSYSGMKLYADYNSYRDTTKAWEVTGKTMTLDQVRDRQERQSFQAVPELATSGAAVVLKNPRLFAAGSLLGKPLGPYRDEALPKELHLAVQPAIHSVSATTANLEWTTSLPALCEVAWGETEACEQSAQVDVNHFGTFSLTGLKPGKPYFFRLKRLSIPTELAAKLALAPVEVPGAPLKFTTLPQDALPATYYVANDGDNSRSGRSRQEAWKTLHHAATKVNVGDTVLIAGGTYPERVRLRATGAPGAPITFKAMPGERMQMDGAEQTLNSAFVARGKSHLRFDAMYFARYNLFPTDGWRTLTGADFHLYQGEDIEISRCFNDGRGGYSAMALSAMFIDHLTVRNCVNTYKMGGAMYIWRCPNLRVENSVFAEPMINSFILRNTKTQAANMDHNIFTDMLDKKAKLNIGLFAVDGEIEAFRQRNNAYFLRAFPAEERAINGTKTLAQLTAYISEPLVADPLFAGDPGLPGKPKDKTGFSPDRLMDPTLALDFDSFFATNPELIKRGIGLQPEAFRDFKFQRPKAP